ncbi:MAG: aminotransferase class V-fold PLP-dependent enzyme [Bacteroidota bacterium]
MNQQQITQWRLDTPGVQHRIHFNNAGAALPPSTVINVQRNYLEAEAIMGGYELAALKREEIQATFQSVAKLLNTKAQNIAFANNATDAYSRALSSVPLEAGDTILTTRNDYVSNIISFLQLQKHMDIQLVLAENAADGTVDVQSVAELITQKRPKLVAVTHIPTSSGLVQDVAAIGALCAAEDIWYLVDACQSVGQLPLDVQAIRCDFLSATGRKFLRGPRGTGFLYVSDKALQAGLEPFFLDLHSAEWTSQDQYRPVDSANRFEIWERNYGLMLGLKSAADYLLEQDMNLINQRIINLASALRDKLSEFSSLHVMEKDTIKSGIVTVKVNDYEALAFQGALLEQKINTSLIYQEGARYDLAQNKAPWVSRISVHYYNTMEEIDQLAEALRRIVT